MAPPAAKQPPSLDEISCVAAPVALLLGADGTVGTDAVPGQQGSAQGLYSDDERLISQLSVTVSGNLPVLVQSERPGADSAVFQYAVPGVGDPGPDTSIHLFLEYSVDRHGLTLAITLSNSGYSAVQLGVEVVVRGDGAPIAVVRSGEAPRLRAAYLGTEHVSYDLPAESVDPLRWSLNLPAGEDRAVNLRFGRQREGQRAHSVPWRMPTLVEGPESLGALLTQSQRDLASLYLAAPERDTGYLTAGNPWYLTLFGRDALWSAQMMLAAGTELAMQTLRALSGYQATTFDARTLAEPGKIPHEVRRADIPHALPPTFYGSSDATSLWIILLEQAWRWGAPESEVSALLRPLQAALTWLTEYAPRCDDGLIRYQQCPGIGPINQGWKDSLDCVHSSAGAPVPFPLAVCEIQGYAYRAAIAGATLLEHFGHGDTGPVREFAERLRAGFRGRFWCSDAEGTYPALAIGANGSVADVLSSNIGHLLGTGILDPDEEAAVVQALMRPELLSPFGLRTLSTRSPLFRSVSYHNGSVWPHDNAIVIEGLRRAGYPRAAAKVAGTLLQTAYEVGPQLPELWGSEPLGSGSRPRAFPTACRPQAWSAAAIVQIITSFVGIEPDLPAKSIGMLPLAEGLDRRLSVHGLRVGGQDVTAVITPEGTFDLDGLPAEVRLRTSLPATRK